MRGAGLGPESRTNADRSSAGSRQPSHDLIARHGQTCCLYRQIVAPVVKFAYGEREPARVLRVASAWGSPAQHTHRRLYRTQPERTDEHMTDQPRFTNTHAQCRAKAIEVAASVLGTPSDYQQSYSQTGKPIEGKGLMGALGATSKGGTDTQTGNTYPSALIDVAAYIAAGRIEADQ